MVFIILISVILALPVAVGIGAVAVGGRRSPRNQPTGLLFHAITPHHNTHFSYFPPDSFNQLIEALVQQKAIIRTLHDAALDKTAQTIFLTFDDGFQNFYSQAFPVLENFFVKATLFPIAGFIGRSSEWDVLPRQNHLSRSQIREIASHGHEIGSHSMTHADLRLLSRGDVERELLDSKHFLEDISGKPVTSLSFPFGSWSKRVWEIAQQLGYTQATVSFFHGRQAKGLLPVLGVYSFDTVQDVLDKILVNRNALHTLARCRIMPHFAKGTPLWKFRKNYALLR
jgi:peptidoglycan/xylan/chitin deacetylase (PgdA/CDA1 family)